MKKSLRIVMFSPAFAPLTGPEAIVSSKLAMAFLRYGWHVTVISRESGTFATTVYTRDSFDEWKELESVTNEIRYERGGRIVQFADFVRTAARTRQPLAGCRWAERAYRRAAELHSKDPFDIIVSRASPDIAHLPAFMLHRDTALPWIANWNDPSDLRPPQEFGMKSGIHLGCFHARFLRQVSAAASWHTFPSDRLRSYMSEYLGDITDRSSIIPHAAMPSARTRRRGDRSSFVLCHAGDLSSERNPEILFQSIALLRKQPVFKKYFRCWIVGNASEESQRFAEQYHLTDVIEWKGKRSYSETMSFLRHCDVALVQEVPYAEGIFLPSKLVDYVQESVPVLAVSPRTGVVHDMLTTYGGGIAADCRSVDNVTEALQALFISWKKKTLRSYVSKKLATYFSAETILETYRSLFERLGIHVRP